MGRYGTELILHRLAHIQPFNELSDSVGINGFARTGKGFQCLIGMRVSLSSENRLHSFGLPSSCLGRA